MRRRIVEDVVPVVILVSSKSSRVARVLGDVVVVGGAMRVVDAIGVDAHRRVIVDDVEGVVPVDDEQRAVFFFLSVFTGLKENMNFFFTRLRLAYPLRCRGY